MKQTKEFFIRQSEMAAPHYPADQFPAIYDRITKNQFKTDTLDLEKALARVQAYQGIDIEGINKDFDIQNVQRGDMFIKYGRRGQPHPRFVYITSDEQYLIWCVKDFSDTQSL